MRVVWRTKELGDQDSWICHLLSPAFPLPGFPALPEEEVFGLKTFPNQESFGQFPPRVEAA